MRKGALLCVAALALVLGGTGTVGAKDDKKDESPAVKAARDFNANPYPSTYKPYPGLSTLITGATIFDGRNRYLNPGEGDLPKAYEW